MNNYNEKSSQNTKNKKLKTYIIIQTNSYKSFLRLFDRNEVLEDFEFGDTGYEKEGYVNEKVFSGLHSVGDILDFDYDSDEPIVFNAKIGQLEIEFNTSHQVRQYRVYGEDFNLRVLINKMTELNAHVPNGYIYSELCHYLIENI